MFCKVNITLILKCDRRHKKKTQYFCEHRCKTSKQNICKQNLAIYIKKWYVTIKSFVFHEYEFALLLKVSINVIHYVNRIKEKMNISEDEEHTFATIQYLYLVFSKVKCRGNFFNLKICIFKKPTVKSYLMVK